MREKKRAVTTKLFCSDKDCVEVFNTEKDLEVHLSMGKHSYANQNGKRCTTNDKVKLSFANKLKEASFSHTKTRQSLPNKRQKLTRRTKSKKTGKKKQIDTVSSFDGMGNQMGWALKERKKNAKFSKVQVNFLWIFTQKVRSQGKRKTLSALHS